MEVADCDHLVEIAKDLDVAGVEADLLVALAQRCHGQVLIRRLPAASGERYLAPVMLDVVAAPGEDDMKVAFQLIKWHQDAGFAPPLAGNWPRFIGSHEV